MSHLTLRIGIWKSSARLPGIQRSKFVTSERREPKLRGTLNLNQIDALPRNRDLFDAFNAVRAGGESTPPRSNLNGDQCWAARVVDGTTWTGAMAVRTNTTTRAQLANGNVGAFVNFLNTVQPVRAARTMAPSSGGMGSPKTTSQSIHSMHGVSMLNNLGNSTYHALQLQFTRRFTGGFTNTTTWTWSKALGESDTDPGTTYRDPSNRSIEKTNLGFDRTHQITSNGIWKLPFGRDHLLLAMLQDGSSRSWASGNWAAS